MNVHRLVPDSLPCEVEACCAALHANAKQKKLTGIAFVAYIEGHGYIANSAGDAYDNPTLTRGMLLALMDKLALRIDGGNL